MKLPTLIYSASLGGLGSAIGGLSDAEASNRLLPAMPEDLAVPILTFSAAVVLVSATLLACVLAMGPAAPNSWQEQMDGRERVHFDFTWTLLPLVIVFLFAIGARTGGA